MNRRVSKFLAVMLSLCLVAGTAGTSAFAAEGEQAASLAAAQVAQVAQVAPQQETSQTLATALVGSRSTGVYKSGSTWKYFKNGTFTRATGIAKRSTDGVLVFVKNGVFTKATGVAKCIQGAHKGEWLFVKNGVRARYTGFARACSRARRARGTSSGAGSACLLRASCAIPRTTSCTT